MTKTFCKKLVSSLLAAAIVLVGMPTWLLGLTAAAENAGNYIKNPSFEDLDNDTSPDCSPNDWTRVSGGWFVEKGDRAKEGNAYMVAVQDSVSSQTITLPNGYYNFSGWLNPAYNVNEIKITLKSGDNEAAVSVSNGDAAAYKTIDQFQVTDGSLTITLTTDVIENFNATAVVDDLKLLDCATLPTPQVTVTYYANDGTDAQKTQNIDQGVAPHYSPTLSRIPSIRSPAGIHRRTGRAPLIPMPRR